MSQFFHIFIFFCTMHLLVVSVLYVYGLYMSMHVCRGQGKILSILLYHFTPYTLEMGSLTAPGVRLSVSEPHGPPVSPSHSQHWSYRHGKPMGSHGMTWEAMVSWVLGI